MKANTPHYSHDIGRDGRSPGFSAPTSSCNFSNRWVALRKAIHRAWDLPTGCAIAAFRMHGMPLEPRPDRMAA